MIDFRSNDFGPRLGIPGATGEVRAYLPSGGHDVVKLYFADSVETVGSSHVERLIAWRESLVEHDRRFLDSVCAWPRLAVRDGVLVRGFTMPRAPDPYWTNAFGGERLRTIGHLRRPDNEMGTIDVQDEVLLRTLLQFAEVMRFLDLRGVEYRDVSDQNILWTPSGERAGAPALFLLDCDGSRMRSGSSPAVQVQGSRGWVDSHGQVPSAPYAVAAFHIRICRRHSGSPSTYVANVTGHGSSGSDLDRMAVAAVQAERDPTLEDLIGAAARAYAASCDDDASFGLRPWMAVMLAVALAIVVGALVVWAF